MDRLPARRAFHFSRNAARPESNLSTDLPAGSLVSPLSATIVIALSAACAGLYTPGHRV